MIHRRTSCAVLTIVGALAAGAALLAALPAAAATSSAYASGWSSPTAVQWAPMPPSANVTGPPEDPPGPSLCVGASSQPGQAIAFFTFPAFSIPAGDVIQGVEVNMKYETEGEQRVKLTEGGAEAGLERVLPTNPGPSTCDGTSFARAGSPTDTWGLALTPAKFNGGAIGVWFRQKLTTVASDPGSLPIDIDAVQLIVYHGPANTAPTAEANGPYSVAEGGSVVLSSAGSMDPDGDPLSFEWDLDNNGSFETSGASPTFSGVDGPATQTVVLRVSDGIAPPVTDTATVSITNVAPTIALAGTPVPVDEGSPFSLTLGTITDPGTDTVTQWIVKWGDGSSDTYASGGTKTHTYGDGPASPLILVDLVDEDGTHTTAGALSLTVANVPPMVDAPMVTPEPSDEGSPVTASATFSDPATDDSPFSCTVDYGEGDGPQAGSVVGTTCNGPSHTYGDNGTYPVTVCVEDKDNAEGCESADHVVENLPPTVTTPTFAPEPSEEGAGVTASATFSDPGEDDSPFTCTVDYDTADPGVAPAAGTVTGDTCEGDPHTYGDNGTFNVEVCVTDKDGGEGCESAGHVVDNVAPDAQLDTGGAITFPSGEDAFIGRQEDEQSHDAEAEDPGSDDLTFAWDFGFAGPSTTYYNDTGDPSGTPDPFPSPHGTFPFSAADTASVTFGDPGVFGVRVDVTDDDGGGAFDELPKLVTGDGACAYSQGFWRHQFRGRGKPHFDAPTLQAYLDLVNFASAVFSEEVAAAIPAEAQAVFAPGGSFRDKATRQALAAWLNWASGGVAWDEGIDLDGDSVADVEFSALIAMVEAILLDPDASNADLELAKDLAETVNLLDESTETCHPRAGTRPILR